METERELIDIVNAIKNGEVEVYSISRQQVRAIMFGDHSDATDEMLDFAQGEAAQAGFSVIIVEGGPPW